MIKYNRSREGITHPEIICEENKKRANDLELKQMHDDYINNGTKMVFKKSKYGSKRIKEELIKVNHNKCGYCEKRFTITYYGDVDHFRPKSHYWWLAYTWENLVVTCTICNSTYKGANFPINGVRADNPEDDLEREEHLLINPMDEDPEQFIKYELEPNGVLIRPKEPAFTDRIEACEAYYGINREDLADDRNMKLEQILLTIATFQSPEVSAQLHDHAERVLRLLASDRAEYAGMTKYFLELNNIQID